MDIYIDGRLYLIVANKEPQENIIPFPQLLTKRKIEGIPLSLLPECFKIMAERGELFERQK
ncbi:hypothetical protein ACJVQT_23015 [Enterobacter huaxiensis]|uniref:hypothetical protein n=1 Tax=Enterobacter huaxiensis TaxID=2494702 RepID=UPI002175A997|nr:hypothetical protein [Enterobacter huaxiensis]MCS5452538.1 hypothetical protein [Enterobacter huaxiensis]